MSRDADGTAVGLLRDAQNRLVGHAKLRWVDESSWVANNEDGTFFASSDEDAPDISRLVPLVLVIAAGVAGVKLAQHIKSQREEKRSERSGIASASATPAGWYEVASDATRLRYWDGTAWTNDFAQRQGTAAAMAADWYPDPSNAAQLRYWDGTAWTHHVAPTHGAAGTPTDWYPDPSNAAQLRYWDGTAWTHHVAPTHGAAGTPTDWYPDPWNAAQLRYWDGTVWTHHVAPKHGTAGVARQPFAAPSPERGLVSAREEPRISMSSAEWQAHVRAWMAASAIEQELWRRLSNAHISDAGQATLEAQREMEQLTPEQGAYRIRLMLEAHPSMRDGVGLTEFMKFFGGGRSALGRDVPVSIERTNETRRPMESRT